MEKNTPLKVTREKHLDHMVKVVPFIVFCYGVHSYILLNLGANPASVEGVILLGGLLAILITSLVIYDIKHSVELDEENIKICFFGPEKIIPYQQIHLIEVVSPEESFSTVKIKTKNGTHKLYFIDEAEKVKKWVEEKQMKEEKKAA